MSPQRKFKSLNHSFLAIGLKEKNILINIPKCDPFRN